MKIEDKLTASVIDGVKEAVRSGDYTRHGAVAKDEERVCGPLDSGSVPLF